MDTFDKTLIAAADSFFELPGAETVTYLPASGASRKIRAVITRTGPENLPSVSGGSLPAFGVLVKNHATAGISSETIDTGGDKIECAKRLDERPKVLRLIEIINHDAAMMLLAAS